MIVNYLVTVLEQRKEATRQNHFRNVGLCCSLSNANPHFPNQLLDHKLELQRFLFSLQV